MKTYTIAAIILITIGIMAFAYQGITYTTIVGTVALVGGIVLLVVGKKKA